MILCCEATMSTVLLMSGHLGSHLTYTEEILRPDFQMRKLWVVFFGPIVHILKQKAEPTELSISFSTT